MKAVRIKEEIYQEAQIRAEAESRSTAEQLSYWARLGKTCEENPKLPFQDVKSLLISHAEANAGRLEEYKLGS